MTVAPRLQPAKNLPAWLKTLVGMLLLCQIGACFAGRAPSLAGKVDFRAFYVAGYIVRTGHAAQLYDYAYQNHVQNAIVGYRDGALPFLYPPFAAIGFVPFSFVSYRVAFAVFALWNGLLLLGAMWLLRRHLGALQAHGGTLPVALALCVFPVAIAFMQGQVSFLLLFLSCAAWVCIERRHDWLAGLLLSLLMIKFQLAIPVFLLFLSWRKWRICTGFLSGGLALTSISWLVCGSSGLAGYTSSLFALGTMTVASAGAAKARYGMYPTDMPNLHGLLFGLSHGATAGLLLCGVFSLAVLIFAASRRANLATALLAAMLVSYHMQPHDLVLLILPLCLIASRELEPSEGPDRKSSMYPLKWSILLLMLTFPLFPVLMMMGKTYLVSLPVLYLFLETSSGLIRIRGQDTQSFRWALGPSECDVAISAEPSFQLVAADQIG